jgi:hypothetical protein
MTKHKMDDIELSDEENKLFLEHQKEFKLKYKCPCYEYDEHACKFNKKEECPFKTTLKDAFIALHWCLNNPMREIEVEEFIEGDIMHKNPNKLTLRCNKYGNIEVLNEDCWEDIGDIIKLSEIESWKNIRIVDK